MVTSELKQLFEDILYLVEDGLDSSDEYKSALQSKLDYYTYKDDGSTNSIILNPIIAENNPDTYIDGMVVYFTPNAINDDICTINVNGIGEKPLKNHIGLDMPAHFLDTENAYIAVYLADLDEFRCYNLSIMLKVVPILDTIADIVSQELSDSQSSDTSSTDDSSTSDSSDSTSTTSSTTEEIPLEDWEVAINNMNESHPLSDAVELVANDSSELISHLNSIPDLSGSVYKIILKELEYDVGDELFEFKFTEDDRKRVHLVGVGVDKTIIRCGDGGDSNLPLIRGEYLYGGVSGVMFEASGPRAIFELHNSVFENQATENVKFVNCDNGYWLMDSVVKGDVITMEDVIRGLEIDGSDENNRSVIVCNQVNASKINKDVDYALIAKNGSYMKINTVVTTDVEVPTLTLSKATIDVGKFKQTDTTEENDPLWKF